jgi:SPP1 family predicted phage head-tail adaptor
VSGLPGAGALRTLLEVQALSDISDEMGGAAGQWLGLFKVWAQISVANTGIVTHGGVRSAQTTHIVLVRHRGDIFPGMRFVLGTRIFEIDTVCDPDETGRYLRCTTHELQ